MGKLPALLLQQQPCVHWLARLLPGALHRRGRSRNGLAEGGCGCIRCCCCCCAAVALPSLRMALIGLCRGLGKKRHRCRLRRVKSGLDVSWCSSCSGQSRVGSMNGGGRDGWAPTCKGQPPRVWRTARRSCAEDDVLSESWLLMQ
jgi:hypothetical protein